MPTIMIAVLALAAGPANGWTPPPFPAATAQPIVQASAATDAPAAVSEPAPSATERIPTAHPREAESLSQPDSTKQPAPPARQGIELRTACRQALARWRTPSDEDMAKAAREFLVLFTELMADRKLETIERQNYAIVVRSRLMKLSMQIDKAWKEKAAKQPATLTAPEGGDAVLGHMFGAGAGVNMQQGFGAGGGLAQGPGGGGAGDYGPALVELIQTTISPKMWDINGGPGHVHYWQQQRALIVAAPQDVHDQIGGVLEQLNRLQR